MVYGKGNKALKLVTFGRNRIDSVRGFDMPLCGYSPRTGLYRLWSLCMRMQKRQFRIGELAKHLGVERFVVRFWEREFGLKPTRSDGGQRFYEERDLEKLQVIKDLLYDKGLTIAGAKRMLESEVQPLIVASQKTTFEEKTCSHTQQIQELHNQLLTLRAQLMTLQELI
jgi:DNA-binding transcriptional MerR regulator